MTARAKEDEKKNVLWMYHVTDQPYTLRGTHFFVTRVRMTVLFDKFNGAPLYSIAYITNLWLSQFAGGDAI